MGSITGKKILILGGANLHCKLVRAAKEMGLYTIVTDYLDDSPAKRIADKSYKLNITDVDGIVEMCRKEGVDAVISTHLDPCQRPYYEICHRLGVPCYINSYEQVFALTDKDAFKACCIKNGVDIIPTYDISKTEEIEYPVLVKPVHSRGSRGQSVCYNLDDVKKALPFAQSESGNGKAIIEKYMGNKGDFTMTYIFVDGVPYMTKTSDRYLGDIELGLEKVGIGTLSPSYYTDMYISNVQARLLGMLKDLNIKNGPVFMQGFIDGDTVRFYDPGYRFPGSEYDTMFEQIWDIDIMKLMVEFAITGKMNNRYFKLTNEMERLNGKYVITLWPTVREGTVSEIQGVDIISEFPEVIGYTFRHEIGETIPFSRDVNQRFCEFDIIADSITNLKQVISKIQEVFHVIDAEGKDMLIGQLNVEAIPNY